MSKRNLAYSWPSSTYPTDLCEHNTCLELTHHFVLHGGLQDAWRDHLQHSPGVLPVAQATRILRKSRSEIQKFEGFLEWASARALHLPSVTSRVFHMEVTNRVSGTHRNGVVYWNDSEYECEGKRSGGSEFV